MAGFVTEDGKGGISGDRFMDELNRKNNQTYTESWIVAHPVRKHHTDVNKMKMPPGRKNCDRLLNSNMYDLLAHIQQTLSLTGRCILEMIIPCKYERSCRIKAGKHNILQTLFANVCRILCRQCLMRRLLSFFAFYFVNKPLRIPLQYFAERQRANDSVSRDMLSAGS